MKLLAFILLVFSQMSFAQNDLETIKEMNPGASNREILKLFYEGSLSAAELSDFDKGDNANSSQECRMVLHSQGDTLISVVIRQIQKEIPGNGPLFPAHTEIKLNITGIHSLSNGKVTEVFNKAFDYTTVEENAYDLTIYQKKNPHHMDAPFKLFLRKNGDLISFKILTYKNGQDNGPLFENSANVDYGYCWRNQAN